MHYLKKKDPSKPVLNPKKMKVSEQIKRGIMPDPMIERRHRRPKSAFDFCPESTITLGHKVFRKCAVCGKASYDDQDSDFITQDGVSVELSSMMFEETFCSLACLAQKKRPSPKTEARH